MFPNKTQWLEPINNDDRSWQNWHKWTHMFIIQAELHYSKKVLEFGLSKQLKKSKIWVYKYMTDYKNNKHTN